MSNVGRAMRALIALIGTALVGLVSAPLVSAHSGDEIGEFATATVDGAFSTSEYEGSCTPTLFQSSSTTNYDFTICEVSDETNDYWAIRISDLTIDDGDSALIWFDNNHDGVVHLGTNGDCPLGDPVEDYIGFLFGGFFDSWYCNMPPVTGAFGDTGPFDGAVARVHYPSPGAQWVYEFSHPLDSGDPDDYAVSEGATLGWCFMYNNDSDPTNSVIFGELQYPPGCFGAAGTDDAASGKTLDYADVFKESKLHDLAEALKDKLKDLVATCRFCPPDPTLKLKEKINEVLEQLRANREPAAIRALEKFIATARKLIAEGELPNRAKKFTVKGKQFLKKLNAPPAPAGPSVPGPGGTPGATHPGSEFDLGDTGDRLPPCCISIEDVTLNEGNMGNTTATFRVSLSEASTQTATVAFQTANGTATAGSDYVATNGTLTFAPGETTKTVAVAVVGDRLSEPNETFKVNLSVTDPANGTIADGEGIGTITNDDR